MFGLIQRERQDESTSILSASALTALGKLYGHWDHHTITAKVFDCMHQVRILFNMNPPCAGLEFVTRISDRRVARIQTWQKQPVNCASANIAPAWDWGVCRGIYVRGDVADVAAG